MTRPVVAPWLDMAGTAATGAFILALVVHMLRAMRAGGRRPIPYWLMLTFLAVALALDAARVVVRGTLASWFGTALHAALVGLVLYMRRVLNRLDAKLEAYKAETARLRAENAERALLLGRPEGSER